MRTAAGVSERGSAAVPDSRPTRLAVRTPHLRTTRGKYLSQDSLHIIQDFRGSDFLLPYILRIFASEANPVFFVDTLRKRSAVSLSFLFVLCCRTRPPPPPPGPLSEMSPFHRRRRRRLFLSSFGGGDDNVIIHPSVTT